MDGMSPNDFGSDAVVFRDLFLGRLADLTQVVKQVGIEYLPPVTSIEAFDKAVLHRLARMDVFEFDTVVVALGHEQGRRGLRAMVGTDAGGLPRFHGRVG